MSFASELRNFTVKAERNAEKVFRDTTIALFSQIIKRTPVKTGRLRGNWQTDVNRKKETVIERSGADAAINEVVLEASQANLGDSIYLTNNLPYAKVIEGGSSTQAPSGMVKVTALEFEREIKKQSRRLI